jgi:tetraacyldisaccharide 4'-kinase
MLYSTAITSRNRRFDRGEGVQRVDRPVVSVGNITTGGTGKTPMVAWIAQTLLEAGHHPAIAMRGYKAARGEAGDEELEYRSLLPLVPVIANPDRVSALRSFLPQHREIDCVILDDGFQHRRLHRDLDLALIDAKADTLRDELLPAGNLREPPANLSRASAVIITHADDGVDAGLAQEIDRWHGKPPLAWTRHAWTGLFSYIPLREGLAVTAERSTNISPIEKAPSHANALTPALSQREREFVSVNWLRGKRVLTLLGVGNPKAVIAQIEAAGAKVMADIPAGDHERFDRAKLLTAGGLAEGLDAMIVTRKDWVKIAPIVKSPGGAWRTPIVVPQLEIEFIDGEDRLKALLTNAVNEDSRASR